MLGVQGSTIMPESWSESIGEEDIKVPQFADDRIFYTENHEVFTQRGKRLELINEFSEIARYKNNMQKSVAFLYTNNDQKVKARK